MSEPEPIGVNTGPPLPAESEEDDNAPLSDERVWRQVRERRGQASFRRGLLARFGQCVVSGCRTTAVLEAAHVRPYSEVPDNTLSNGLLLRADIHTLFDLNLLGIHPESLEIWLHPSINRRTYARFSRNELRCEPGLAPRQEALLERWARFESKLIDRE